MIDADCLSIRTGASTSTDPATAAEELFEAIHQPDAALSVFYCSPDYDLDKLGASLARWFDCDLIGCTTAGEITPEGYRQGSLAGVTIASDEITAVTRRLDDLPHFAFNKGGALGRLALQELEGRGVHPDSDNTFGFLLIDGLSMQEEAVISSLYRSLGNVPLFGGSAGDGTRFEKTCLYHEGRFRTDCALFTLVHTTLPFTVFKTAHFAGSAKKMVITEADPTRRIVTEINGAPAAREYARMVGIEVDELSEMMFATHPVVVQLGGDYYVRSIQRVNDDESLSFFCAIDEGIVLTVASRLDLLGDLEHALHDVTDRIGPPRIVLACDSVLRSIELGQTGLRDRAAELMAAHNVVGFCSYGEQFNEVHVNQTFTGVAIGEKSEAHD